MSFAAIVLMILAMVIIWGGLFVATRFLMTHPLPPEDGDDVRPARRRRR